MTRTADAVLAIDVGGTKTALAIIDRAGEWLARSTIPTRVGGDDVIRVAEAARDWVVVQVRNGVTPTPRAVAAGFPEYVDASGRLTSREVVTWSGQPSEALADAFDGLVPASTPVLVDSDVRLGAIGEATWGAGRGANAFIYASLGTGLSTTFVLDGVAWPGKRGEAIAFGEWPVPDSPHGSEGSAKNLEAYVSGAGMASRYLGLTGEAVDTVELSRRALLGDDLAKRVQHSAGRALGRSLGALVAVLDPDRVVLGGGLGTSEAPVVAAARRAYVDAVGGRPMPPQLVTASTGADAGLLGAATRAWRAVDANRPSH